MTVKKSAEDKTEYEVVLSNGEVFRIEVPSSYKVTFGPVTAPTKGSYGGQNYALRFYEAENKQRMILTDVKSFRDTSIPIKKQIKTVTGETKSKESPDKKEFASVTETDRKWETI